MKKFLVFLFFVLTAVTAFAVGENIPTSKSYVDSAVAQKQDKIPANNGAEQILMNTGTPGSVGTKDIYDSTGAYATQTDALVTAEQFNTAVQNAIDNEFECVGWDQTHTHCWFVKIRGVTDQTVLPTGYTALEYLKKLGATKIDTGITANASVVVDMQVLFSGVSGTYVAIGTRNGTNTRDENVFEFGVIKQYNSFFHRYGVSDGPNNNDVPAANTLYTVHLENMYCTVSDGVNTYVNRYEFKATMNTSGTLYLFGVNDIANGSQFFMPDNSYITYCKIYKNNEMVRDFVPARRDRDGELGMYDLVSNTFFTNAGTGEFIAGPVANNIYLPSGN